MDDLDNKTLVKVLNFIAEEYMADYLKLIARQLRIKKYGLKNVDGEFHFVEEVKE